MIHALGGDLMSILNTVKKNLGIHETYTHFDVDVMMHINTVFVILNQLGVGPEEGFDISDHYTEWEDYSTDIAMNIVKTYMYLKVRMMFDPPIGSVKDAIERQIAELEFRINIECEKTIVSQPEVNAPECDCPWYD